MQKSMEIDMQVFKMVEFLCKLSSAPQKTNKQPPPHTHTHRHTFSTMRERKKGGGRVIMESDLDDLSLLVSDKVRD